MPKSSFATIRSLFSAPKLSRCQRPNRLNPLKSRELLPLEELPELPSAAAPTVAPNFEPTIEDSRIVAETAEQVIVEEVINIPLLDLLAPNSPEALGSFFFV